jgi:hypothetical protein
MMILVFLPLSLAATPSPPELTLSSLRVEKVSDQNNSGEEYRLKLEIVIPEGFYQEKNSPFFSVTLSVDEELKRSSEAITVGDIESVDYRLYKERKILKGRAEISVSLSGPRELIERLTVEKESAEKAVVVVEYQLCNFEGSCYYPQRIKTTLKGGIASQGF